MGRCYSRGPIYIAGLKFLAQQLTNENCSFDPPHSRITNKPPPCFLLRKTRAKTHWIFSRRRFLLNLMEVRTVKVSNVSLTATDHDLKEFFSFSGEIEYVQLHSDNERSQLAYVTFKDATGAETSVLLSGATIVDQPVTIDIAAEYKLPAAVASALPAAKVNVNAGGAESAVRKAEDVVSSMLAKGFILGKDAISKAKAFDEKHSWLYSTATATVASLDQKIGLREKLSAGTTLVNDTLRQMDERFQVSDKTKSAFSAAEQTVTTAGSALMSNRYILTGTTWATGAYNRAAQAASEVSQKTREKVLAEEYNYANKAEQDNKAGDADKAEEQKAEGGSLIH